MKIKGKEYRTVWIKGNTVRMINQSLIPHRFEIVDLHDYKEIHDAIKNMIVRGAPAIGATAAYGLAQAVMKYDGPLSGFKAYITEVRSHIAKARPTAYDLFHGLDHVMASIKDAKDLSKAKMIASSAAKDYADKSVAACRKIGEFGNSLIKDGDGILTHCNAGALATVDYGTALAPIRTAHENKKNIFVFADETRPRSQGSRLTAFELAEEGIPHAVIADNAAGHYMRTGKIQICIVGSDRTAANGDVANKIGTYGKAVVAYENNIPFYVAIPLSTIDLDCQCGDDIPIEERSEDEVTYSYGWDDSGRFGKVRLAPENSSAKNPAFDVTPAKYITGLITPKGIIKPCKEDIEKLFKQ